MEPLSLAWAALTNRWVQLALAVFAAYTIGHHNGYQAKVDQDARAVVAQQAKVAKVEHKDAAINTGVNVGLAKAQGATQATTNANLGKVRTYVTPKADAGCILTTGAVRLLDASGRDVPVAAPTPGELQDEPSGVAISELVADEVVNAGSYHQLIEALDAWDLWYDAHAANWGSPSRPGTGGAPPL